MVENPRGEVACGRLAEGIPTRKQADGAGLSVIQWSGAERRGYIKLGMGGLAATLVGWGSRRGRTKW